MNEDQDIQHLQGEHRQNGHMLCSGIKQAPIEGFGGCKSAGGKKWGYHGVFFLNMNGDQNIQNLQHWQNGNGFSYGTKYLDIGGYKTKTMLGVSENLPPESFKKNQIMGPRRDTTIYCNLMRNITINPNMAF